MTPAKAPPPRHEIAQSWPLRFCAMHLRKPGRPRLKRYHLPLTSQRSRRRDALAGGNGRILILRLRTPASRRSVLAPWLHRVPSAVRLHHQNRWQGDRVATRERLLVTRSLGSYRPTFLPSRLIGTTVAHVSELIGGQSRRSPASSVAIASGPEIADAGGSRRP
jgi:hypothetical protein